MLMVNQKNACVKVSSRVVYELTLNWLSNDVAEVRTHLISPGKTSFIQGVAQKTRNDLVKIRFLVSDLKDPLMREKMLSLLTDLGLEMLYFDIIKLHGSKWFCYWTREVSA